MSTALGGAGEAENQEDGGGGGWESPSLASSEKETLRATSAPGPPPPPPKCSGAGGGGDDHAGEKDVTFEERRAGADWGASSAAVPAACVAVEVGEVVAEGDAGSPS